MKPNIKPILILLAIFSMVCSRLRKTSEITEQDKHFVKECKSWCTFGAKELYWREKKDTYFCICSITNYIGFTRSFDHESSGWGYVPEHNYSKFNEEKITLKSIPLKSVKKHK